jgi:hypothetical protein
LCPTPHAVNHSVLVLNGLRSLTCSVLCFAPRCRFLRAAN